AKKDLEKIIEAANETMLLRGVPEDHKEGGAKIVRWTTKDNSLMLTIESGMFVRAYTAILRTRKLLSTELGKKYKFGIRKVVATSISFKIPLTTQTSQSALEEIKSSSFVKSIKVENGYLSVILNEMKEHELKRNVPDRMFKEIKIVLDREEERPPANKPLPIVKKSNPKKVKFTKEPMGVALGLGWVKEFPGRGQWIYTTPYTQLFEIIKDLLIEDVVKKLGFHPFMLPKVIPLEVMKKMPGYLEDIPEGMYYVCPPPRDPNAFKSFKEKMKVTKEVPSEELKRVLKDPDYVLAPAQCEPFWQFYGEEILDLDRLPYKLFDCSGWTYRWEGGGVEGMVRLQEFQRIELTYIGSPEKIVQIRDSVLEECTRTADKILDMEWRITAATPFWAKEDNVDFDVKDSKNIAAYDLEIYLPYRGDRENSEWLEIAGCFVHQLKFINSFKIKEMKKREIWTGCTGLGVTRWVAAFLSTYGFDVETWPKRVKDKFEVNYKPVKTLNWPPKIDESLHA
ncbi:serine--tRNA ligase, partial [Candidatus Pacearchaeota archaeon]|nr:serine--tRNA ligase [Candidatus Pacearchaeota archaeon]